MARSVASPHAVNVGDLRRIAQSRLPRMAFDYIDGGADREITLRDNCEAYNEILFRPRCAVATPSPSPTVSPRCSPSMLRARQPRRLRS